MTGGKGKHCKAGPFTQGESHLKIEINAHKIERRVSLQRTVSSRELLSIPYEHKDEMKSGDRRRAE